MVLLTAAAVTAAGVGVYKGGQAAATDLGKKVRRGKQAMVRTAERREQAAARTAAQQEGANRANTLSVEERVARFKQGVHGVGEKEKKRGLFGKK